MNNNYNNNLIMSQLTLRKTLGILAIIFPLILIIGTQGKSYFYLLPTLSDSYWTNSGSVFIGMLCTVGLFLGSYKGYDKTDDIITNIAGICLILTAIFPMEGGKQYLFYFLPETLSNIIHHGIAFISFSLLGIMAFFQFPKSKLSKKRNLIYRICGIIIFISVIGLIPTKFIIGDEKYHLFLILEILIVESFGLSWLIKGIK